MIGLSDIAAVTLVGFAGGTVLGMAARVARFCTLGAIEDALYGGSRDRILMWPLALGVAIAVTATLSAFDLVSLEDASVLRFEFSLSASAVGGLMFGVGMALAGNCGFGALARVGGGDIRSLLIVLVLGIAAYMAAVGPLADLRMTLFPRVEAASPLAGSIPGWLQENTGVTPIYVALSIAVLLVAVAVGDRHFLGNRVAVFWSVMVGLACASAWWGTSFVAKTGFAVIPVESHSFTMPLGEVVLQAMGVLGSPGGFSVGSVAGVLFGAFVGARLQRQFRWEACDDAGELRRQILGGILMGIGGVIALGCSIGQGLSAFSVLAISAPVTLISIAIGAVLGLRYLVEGRNPFNALLPWLNRFRAGSTVAPRPKSDE
jgi:uncharacterized membrane protein YedE/YeeE